MPFSWIPRRAKSLKIPARKLLVVLAAAVALLVANGQSSTQGRLWPLPIEINLTSSFGEYRSGHLHAGLDIKTYGREGVKCQAVDAGYVSRMRASPNGYGKAVYLKLATGETAVYAHLSEFSPALEERLVAEQRKAGRYRVDIYFEAGSFPVERGEIIGYTGKTGASAPHLHFEVRDEHENPTNPLSKGWKLTDKRGPRFKGAVWLPLSAESRVEGQCRDRELVINAIDANTYVARDTVVLEGRIGLGAQIIDRLNSTSGRLAPYAVEMTVDGVLMASITFERFTYGHTGEVELTYEMSRTRKRNGHYLLLFHRNGESLWDRTFVNDGVIDTRVLPKLVGDERRHYTLVVRAIDRAGNVSVATIPFFIGDATDPGNSVALAGDDGDIEGCYFFEDQLNVRADALTREGRASIERAVVAEGSGVGEENGSYALTVDALSGAFFKLETGSGTDVSEAYVLALRSRKFTTLNLEGIGVGLSTRTRSLYADLFIFVQQWDGRVGDTAYDVAGLRPAATPVRVGPLSAVFRKPFAIRYPLGDTVDGREAVYALDVRKNEWRFQGAEIRGDSLVANIRAPGVYGVFIDTEPPRIGGIRVNGRKSYATGAITPEIIIPLEDTGSGVDDGRTEVSVNGSTRIARWDGFSNTLFVPLLGDDAVGAKEISVVAVDLVGNTSRLDEKIVVDDKKLH